MTTALRLSDRPDLELHMRIGFVAAAVTVALTSSTLMIDVAGAAPSSFITTDSPHYFRASKLDGVDVYNDKNDKIGSISEVLVNRAGRAEAVVIGVGGFLGMGEHMVAVPFNDVKWVNKDKADYPEKAVLPHASKEELKKAPEFKYKS